LPFTSGPDPGPARSSPSAGLRCSPSPHPIRRRTARPVVRT